MPDKFRIKLLVSAVAVFANTTVVSIADDATQPSVQITRQTSVDKQAQLTGRIHVEALDGGLMLEDAVGTIHAITAAEIIERQTLDQPFQYLSDDQLAGHLLSTMGNSFRILQTEHFVICSDASDVYTKYCGQLLESVLTKFQVFFDDSSVRISIPQSRMQVIVFRSATTFQQHARQQHPETDFSDVPGYYSIRDNQMLITAVSGDRDFRRHSELLRALKKNLRQVETIVHECVHQLAFNTGLQKRYADIPLWLSEGLAVYFEGTSGRGTLAWSRPGEASRVHLPTLKKQPKFQTLPLATLVSSNVPFRDPDLLAEAYSKSWALIHFLATRKRTNLDELLLAYQAAIPRKTISADQHLERFRAAIGQGVAAASRQVSSHISRLRVPR